MTGELVSATYSEAPRSLVDGKGLTRRQRALRRAAANRARAREGLGGPKPAVEPGRCEGCQGWGVLGRARLRCSLCGGEG